ncbi:MAG: PIG-L family deacetylase [Ignavibacteriae bacterium]|nr:PIG-L family deacetylase [Ignavibacteriota bacterium]
MKFHILRTVLLFTVLIPGLLMGQSPRTMSSAEIQLALKKLTVVGSALYVGAHPDDENTALLSYLAKGRHVRAAYLSMTRGEGGQNLIGSEQGELMGIIRTQELLAARRFDGAEQFFTRAIDFGYSKNSEETIGIWGHDKILSDIVWVIRSFRPDVIITRFSPTAGGHGNHTASAILAEEAFHAAGDLKKFPEQLKYVQPWKPKRILFNTGRFFNPQLNVDEALKIDVGEYNHLLGMSYSEIAGISRSMHKSQGFGASQSRGTQVNYLTHTAGEEATSDLFDGVNLTWSRQPGGEPIGKLLQEVSSAFKPENPSASIPHLLRAYREMNKLQPNVWVETKKAELLDVIRSCAGIWVDALVNTYSAAPGTEIRDSVVVVKRTDIPVVVEGVKFPFEQDFVDVSQELEKNNVWHSASNTRLPHDISYTQPYWLWEDHAIGSYNIAGQELIGRPENQASLVIGIVLKFGDERIELNVPVRYRWVDPVQGELYRPFEIVPPVAINLHERVHMFPKGSQKTITATLKSGAQNVSGEVRLIPPDGWTSRPATIPFTLARKGEEVNVSFSVAKGSAMSNGTFRLEAVVGEKVIAQGMHTVEYDHIPRQTLFPASNGKFVDLDVKLKGTNIGYIVGSGDEVPSGLRQIGYTVTLLSDEDLAKNDLSRFDAIIAGVRVYNTKPSIRNQQKRLLEYVERGGTYIVQYVTAQRLASENLGPFPFEVGRDRVTVEIAPMNFVNPQHAILNSPNKITEKDFDGWVQERGLYFAENLDPRYETIFSSNDPGETPKTGSLIVARHGKGYFMYTGLSFFRQIPAGVPGAYRLLVNMISISK